MSGHSLGCIYNCRSPQCCRTIAHTDVDQSDIHRHLKREGKSNCSLISLPAQTSAGPSIWVDGVSRVAGTVEATVSVDTHFSTAIQVHGTLINVCTKQQMSIGTIKNACSTYHHSCSHLC